MINHCSCHHSIIIVHPADSIIYDVIVPVHTRTHDCMVHEILVHGMIHVHMNVKDPLSQDNVVSVVSHLQDNPGKSLKSGRVAQHHS